MSSEEFIGEGSISHIQEILEEHDAKTIFLVTDKESFSLSGAEAALRLFLEGFEIVAFSDFSPNPKIDDAQRGIALMKETKPDMIVAVGGGSVIDMAKVINILSAQTGELSKIIRGNGPFQRKGMPLVAIPTTSGTGSEATRFAVVYIDKEKYSLSNPYIIPDYSIVDPTLTYKMPPYLTAASGFDVLSQAIESYWAVGSTKESKRYAKEAIRITMKSIRNAVNDPTREARRDMSLAANLAGKAINISKTTAAHAVSYAITTYFGIPHGHAVALTLGKFFIINGSTEGAPISDKRGDEYLKKTMRDLCGIVGGETPLECSRILYALMKDIGLETDLRKLGISRRKDIDLIASKVNLERLGNNPVMVSGDLLRQILSTI